MASFGAPIPATPASDLASLILQFYTRGDVLSQTTQKKPLFKWLREHQESFGGGGGTSAGVNFISDPVQGAYISDSSSALQGYSEDDALNLNFAQNAQRVTYNWREVQMSLVITWTELKKDGITITDNNKVSDHGSQMFNLTRILKNRTQDYMESWARLMNKMFWLDGSTDAKWVQGITGILTDTAAVGTTGGLNRATYSWWRHLTNLNIGPSAANTTLIQAINTDLIQLRRFEGNPDKALCGSDFLAGLRTELVGKGYFTQTGFGGKKAMNLGIAGLYVDGLGMFDYDPTLDDLGKSKRAYFMDSRRVRLRPMEGEDVKVLDPTRPYQYLIFLKTMTWTGALTCTQLNANEVMSVN